MTAGAGTPARRKGSKCGRKLERLDAVYRARLGHQLDQGKAVIGGYFGGANTAQVDKYGDCSDPVILFIEGRNGDAAHGRDLGAKSRMGFGDKLHTTEYWVRCRRCDACRKAHSRWWHYRARTEIEQSNRSWFGTLTLRPEAHGIMARRAMKAAKLTVEQFAGLSPDEQFAMRHKQIVRELQLWIKRVRAAAAYEQKAKSIPLRYCLVAERHKSGLPHYHILIHERGERVPHRILRDQWRHGFVNFKVVKEPSRAAHYVAKYLSKCATARVQASQAYGKSKELLTSSDIDTLVS